MQVGDREGPAGLIEQVDVVRGQGDKRGLIVVWTNPGTESRTGGGRRYGIRRGLSTKWGRPCRVETEGTAAHKGAGAPGKRSQVQR